MKKALSTLGFWLGLIVLCQSLAGATEVNESIAGYESYLSRPDVLKIQPKPHSELGADWSKLTRGHIEFVAMLLEIYKKQDLYFLARDSELLYDLARWEARSDPSILERLHLLNVSRANMHAEHIKEYLAQEGISEDALNSGKKVVFVDTGFSGTIPMTIESYFPSRLKKNFLTQLVCSANPDYPSCRVFLTSINPVAPKLDPGELHGSIISYEYLPRFSARSDRFLKVDNLWQPYSPKYSNGDGKVSKQKGLAYMEDLIFTAQQPEARALIVERRAEWKKLLELSAAGDKAAVLSFLKNLLTSHPEDRYIESMVRDFIDMSETGHLPTPKPLKINVESVGLKRVFSNSIGSNKNALIQKYPEWAPILEDPETEIKKLIQNNEFGKLGALTDAIHDAEFLEILCETLGNTTPSNLTRAFVRMIIEKGDVKTLNALADFTFSLPKSASMREELELLIKKAHWSTRRSVIENVFSQPHVLKFKDLLVDMIKNGTDQERDRIAEYVFSQPYSAQMKDEFKLLIERASPVTLRHIIEDDFSQPHTAEMDDLLQLSIEKGARRPSVIEDVFSQPHSSKMFNSMRLVIEISDSFTLNRLEQEAFSHRFWRTPETGGLRKALKILNQGNRIAYLNHELGVLQRLAEPMAEIRASTIKPIADNLKPGDVILGKNGKMLFVTESVDQGLGTKAYKVKDVRGQLFALKVAKDNAAVTLDSFAHERDKERVYERYHIPHAQITETGSNYVLKEWVEGKPADEWIKNWAKKKSGDDPALLRLKTLITSASSQGVYIGDLNPRNLIWNGSDWIIVDSDGIREGLPQDETIRRYVAKVSERWGKLLFFRKCFIQQMESLL